MEALKDYLRSISSEEAREGFATACGTTLGHLRNVSYGTRPCGTKLAVAIEMHSGGRVRRWHLCPQDWHLIWPELVGTKGAPKPAKKAVGA